MPSSISSFEFFAISFSSILKGRITGVYASGSFSFILLIAFSIPCSSADNLTFFIFFAFDALSSKTAVYFWLLGLSSFFAGLEIKLFSPLKFLATKKALIE